MNNIKRIMRGIALSLIMCICFTTFLTERAYAAAPQTIDKDTVVVKAGKSVKVPFKLSSKKYIMVLAFAESNTSSDKVKQGGLEIKIKKKSGYRVGDYKANLKGYYLEDDFWMFTTTEYAQKKGNYYFVIKNTTNLPLKIKYRVRTYSNKSAQKASIEKKKSVTRGEWVYIGKVVDGMPDYKSIKASDSKIVSDFFMDYNGKLYAYGKKAGKTTVTTILKNGKKFTTTVTVQPVNPNLFAQIYDYDTRDNYFTVRVKNCGERNVTIIRKGAYVEEDHYKSYDRKVSSTKSVTVKPGQTKYIRFYLKGSTTWYDWNDFTLYAKFKYEGKTVKWWVTSYDTAFKKYSTKDTWYDTYWSYYEEDYEYWIVESTPY